MLEYRWLSSSFETRGAAQEEAAAGVPGPHGRGEGDQRPDRANVWGKAGPRIRIHPEATEAMPRADAAAGARERRAGVAGDCQERADLPRDQAAGAVDTASEPTDLLPTKYGSLGLQLSCRAASARKAGRALPGQGGGGVAGTGGQPHRLTELGAATAAAGPGRAWDVGGRADNAAGARGRGHHRVHQPAGRPVSLPADDGD